MHKVERTYLYYYAAAIFVPSMLVFPPPMIDAIVFTQASVANFVELPLVVTTSLNGVYAAISIALLLLAAKNRVKTNFTLERLKQLARVIGLVSVICILMQIMITGYMCHIACSRQWLGHVQAITKTSIVFYQDCSKYLPCLVVFFIAGGVHAYLKRLQFSETSHQEQTTGHFGTAHWATKHELELIHAYSPANGIFTGNDNKGHPLYLPLLNKLTLSPPGGGKTTASSIPVLLSHAGPAFVFDIKGELWAVTARYRAEILGRDVVVIDPFGVTRQRNFKAGKSDGLLANYQFNPFDWIPENKKERDRMINTFAASFVVNEGGSVTHFDENAKILIRGYIDYIMSLDPSCRNLTTLFNLMSESAEEAEITFNQMSQLDGRSAAAANQIKRVGADERGSILSTSYRQIDWMGDSNLQDALATSNFDLRDFMKGNMDIFVVLPEDQVQEHNRLVRMLLSILMSMIVTEDPLQLPKQKMLFLLEELAQLGYTPDVEKCIEVLRARGVVVWTVFQTLSQIDMFEKPDLFKGAAIKQIFTNDDTKTMEWIQTLGGKRTVMTKTLSTNNGDSRQRFQTFGGTVSSGDGESIHETAVDLIQLNEIRELPKDEQIIFLHSAKPIRCKKIRYFEHPSFTGKFDANPLEARN